MRLRHMFVACQPLLRCNVESPLFEAFRLCIVIICTSIVALSNAQPQTRIQTYLHVSSLM